MRVRLTDQAREDLVQIWNHIVNSGSGSEVADRILRRINARIYYLSDFPKRGMARLDLGDDARMLVVERWVVLYRVLPTGVMIARIVDGARDFSRIALAEDDGN